MSVLYDAPGPKARRRTLTASILLSALTVLGLYQLVYRPLKAKGQFSAELWGPLIDPDNEYFSQVWERIWSGFQSTVIAAVYAILCSLLIGTGLALLRIQLRGLCRRRFSGYPRPVALLIRGLVLAVTAVVRTVVEVCRGIPVVITIVFVWVALPQFGLVFENARWYLVIGLTIYNSVVIGEILRSGMEGLPSGQSEAAAAIGLTSGQTTRLILLPQAFRIMLPSLISQLVVVFKDTSLGFILSYEETLRVGRQIQQVLDNPIQVFTIVGIIFISVNYALSRLAQYTQRRLARSRHGRTSPPGAHRAPAGHRATGLSGIPGSTLPRSGPPGTAHTAPRSDLVGGRAAPGWSGAGPQA